MNVSIRTSPHPDHMNGLSSDKLRELFVVEKVFSPGDINITFTNLDRLAVGGAQPVGGSALTLENHKETGSDFFLQRRELGIINVGGRGIVRADGKEMTLENQDCAYISMGTKNVTCESIDKEKPAMFFLMSCPSHAEYPTVSAKKSQANPVALGSQATANQRKIYQYIHAGERGIKSAQLVMGLTELAEGSVWNTMPPHTHLRRSEIYFYFDVGGENGDAIVSHFLGEPRNSRHVFLHNHQAVLSPPWSIHCGCGTASYRFIWAMAGENQTFEDMDKVAPLELR